MKPLLLRITCLIFFAPALHAQQAKIEADRPGQSISSFTTPKGTLQVEAGFEKFQQNLDDYDLHHPDLLLKYGLFNRLDVRLELVSKSEKNYSLNEFRYGMLPVELGFKTMLFKQRGLWPQTSIVAQAGFPNWAVIDFQQPSPPLKLRTLFDNELTDKIKLEYNAGASRAGDGSPTQWLYTFEPQLELSENWDVFVETFAYLQKGASPQHHIDGGFAYHLGKNLKFDLWGGKGLSAESPDYFLSVGVSARLPR